MAPQPKRRHSHHRTGRRRSQISLDLPTLTTCDHCKLPTPTHQACQNCGYYKGEKVI